MNYAISIILSLAVVLVSVDNIIQTGEVRSITKASVYAVCNQSRQELNGTAERACGDIQDQTGTEFLCSANNMEANTHCWVEVK